TFNFGVDNLDVDNSRLRWRSSSRDNRLVSNAAESTDDVEITFEVSGDEKSTHRAAVLLTSKAANAQFVIDFSENVHFPKVFVGETKYSDIISDLAIFVPDGSIFENFRIFEKDKEGRPRRPISSWDF